MLRGKFKQFNQAVLDSMIHQMAVIDQDGFIVAVNKAWTAFNQVNGGSCNYSFKGTNYLNVLKPRNETLQPGSELHTLYYGILHILKGESTEFAYEYPCHSPTEKRWFMMTVAPLLDDDCEICGAVVTHINITDRKKLEKMFNKELEIARTVQEWILPPPVNADKISIHGYYRASTQLSGDLYLWMQLDSSQYAVFILDVMGHGVPASLISMSIHSYIKTIIHQQIAPQTVISMLNNFMFENFSKHEQMYCTGIYLLIDINKLEIQYTNGGHPIGLVYSNEQIIRLDKGGIPIGLFPNADFEKGVIKYERGATILMYTDGLFDCTGTGLKKSEKLLSDILIKGEFNSSESLIQYMKETVIKDEEYPDDILVVSIYLH